MAVNRRPMKRIKRRITAERHDFLTFPWSVSGGTSPFRENIKHFLTKHALIPPYSTVLPHLLTWQMSFRVGELTESADLAPPLVILDVVEEDVAKSRSVYCDQCRVVGWSGNPVCSKRYHFIIKADGASLGGYRKPCTHCGDILHVSGTRCKSCNNVPTTEDLEDLVHQQLEDTTHLLHGVIHVNGYGHLLRVNGREGGSRFLSGRHIMDFWDRLCKALGVRKVSVMDVSKKYGLEYRLLHAITKGHSWYGDWGYEFGTGSFGLTIESYKSAVETLSSLPLPIPLSQNQQSYSRLQERISFYQLLSESPLVNARQLFCYLMSLIRKDSAGVNAATFKTELSKVSHQWCRTDIERVHAAMLRVLRAVTTSNWVSSRALRGAVCRAAPPHLLDFCLTELGGMSAGGGMVVNARKNPDYGAVEFRLEPGSPDVITCGVELPLSKTPSFEILMQDLKFFYESILHPQSQTMQNYAPKEIRALALSSAEKLLDCKKFIKEYKPERVATLNASAVHLSCEVQLEDEPDVEAPTPPPELIILPLNATVGDLKVEASKAYQDVYLMFKRFEAEHLIGYRGVDDSTQVKLLLGSTESVSVGGKYGARSGQGKYRMEKGTERWTVDCVCGAKDDDGERMFACDVCSEWQHTRCCGIQDSGPVPARFVCERCIENDISTTFLMNV